MYKCITLATGWHLYGYQHIETKSIFIMFLLLCLFFMPVVGYDLEILRSKPSQRGPVEWFVPVVVSLTAFKAAFGYTMDSSHQSPCGFTPLVLGTLDGPHGTIRWRLGGCDNCFGKERPSSGRPRPPEKVVGSFSIFFGDGGWKMRGWFLEIWRERGLCK